MRTLSNVSLNSYIRSKTPYKTLNCHINMCILENVSISTFENRLGKYKAKREKILQAYFVYVEDVSSLI